MGIESDCICAICLDHLDNKQTFTLPCGHTFHTECQINWFLNGQKTCPNCRSCKTLGDLPVSKYSKNITAFQIMSYRARRKDAKPELKMIYKKYKVIQKNIKEYNLKIKALLKSTGKYCDIRNNIRKLKIKLWNYKNKNRKRIIYRDLSNLCEIISVYST